jgi:hypothetical protein
MSSSGKEILEIFKNRSFSGTTGLSHDAESIINLKGGIEQY